jgi:hypothetical protein
MPQASQRRDGPRQEPGCGVPANKQEGLVRGAQGHELGQILEAVDESREDVSDAGRGAAGISRVCEEDEGRIEAVSHEPYEVKVILQTSADDAPLDRPGIGHVKLLYNKNSTLAKVFGIGNLAPEQHFGLGHFSTAFLLLEIDGTSREYDLRMIARRLVL